MKKKAPPAEPAPPLYSLVATQTQLSLIAQALEFHMRWCIGQFGVPTEVEFRETATKYRADNNMDPYPVHDTHELLAKLRADLFPELRGPGHSYGVGWNEKPEQQSAQRAYEIYKEILYEFSKGQEGPLRSVHAFKPCLFYSDQPIVTITKILPPANEATSQPSNESH